MALSVKLDDWPCMALDTYLCVDGAENVLSTGLGQDRRKVPRQQCGVVVHYVHIGVGCYIKKCAV